MFDVRLQEDYTLKTFSMLFALFNLFKGRFSKESINEAKASEKRMTRQEALQQMRNIASKRVEKKS